MLSVRGFKLVKQILAPGIMNTNIRPLKVCFQSEIGKVSDFIRLLITKTLISH